MRPEDVRVTIEISLYNKQKLEKIADDMRHAQAKMNADGDVVMPDVTIDDVLQDLCFGRF